MVVKVRLMFIATDEESSAHICLHQCWVDSTARTVDHYHDELSSPRFRRLFFISLTASVLVSEVLNRHSTMVA